MERRAGAAEVGPLRHGLEMVNRLGGLDLDSPQQLVPPVARRQDEVRKNLDLPDLDRNGLAVADIGNDLLPLLEADLEQPDDPIMLELLADRAHQYWAQMTSDPERSVNDA